MITLWIDIDDMNNINLDELDKYVVWSPGYVDFIKLDYGKEHYKLLASLSRQCPHGSNVHIHLLVYCSRRLGKQFVAKLSNYTMS